MVFYFPPGLYAGAGYPPIAYSTNLAPVSDDGWGLFLDTRNLSPAFVNYNVQETVPAAHRNLNYSLGTIFLYFAPNWASVTRGGGGPGQTGYLLAGGDFSSNAPHGRLTVSIDAGGSNLCFGGIGGGNAEIYMSAPISWASNTYHQLAIEYSTGDCEMYVDGAMVATGNGVEYVPARSTWTNGFYFGSLNTGYGQARGSFLEAFTWNVEVGGGYTNDWLAISNEIAGWQTAQAATSSGGMTGTESGSGGIMAPLGGPIPDAPFSTNLAGFQIIGIVPTIEQAVQLTWNSVSNEVYQIDEADDLGMNADGSTTWNVLYTQYPSQGTNTFWLDTGNYMLAPPIVHPKYSPMRFYQIVDLGPDTTSDEPTVSIVTPTNGSIASGNLTITVTASTDQATVSTTLYVDGQEMPPSLDGSNYVINTCEWPNGTHTLFATATCESALENLTTGPIAVGHAVSAFVPVTFNNLVTMISFSQPFFNPAAGQIQTVTAVFPLNVNWTLRIVDSSTNVVQTATGSGGSMQYNWDGTGTNGVTVPPGVYYYLISAQTNGLALPNLSGGTQRVSAQNLAALSNSSFAGRASPNDSSNGGSGQAPPNPQTNPPAPARPPTAPVAGITGTFGIAYDTYTGSANGTNGYSLAIPLNGLGLGPIHLNGTSGNYLMCPPLPSFRNEAYDFELSMKIGSWSPAFVRADDQFTIGQLKGPENIFNAVDLGVLLLHGAYGNSADYSGGAGGAQTNVPCHNRWNKCAVAENVGHDLWWHRNQRTEMDGDFCLLQPPPGQLAGYAKPQHQTLQW